MPKTGESGEKRRERIEKDIGKLAAKTVDTGRAAMKAVFDEPKNEREAFRNAPRAASMSRRNDAAERALQRKATVNYKSSIYPTEHGVQSWVHGANEGDMARLAQDAREADKRSRKYANGGKVCGDMPKRNGKPR